MYTQPFFHVTVTSFHALPVQPAIAGCAKRKARAAIRTIIETFAIFDFDLHGEGEFASSIGDS